MSSMEKYNSTTSSSGNSKSSNNNNNPGKEEVKETNTTVSIKSQVSVQSNVDHFDEVEENPSEENEEELSEESNGDNPTNSLFEQLNEGAKEYTDISGTIEEGANLYACDEEGNTPLHIAVEMFGCNTTAVDEILSSFDEPSIRFNYMKLLNKNGEMALHCACQVACDYAEEVITTLLSYLLPEEQIEYITMICDGGENNGNNAIQIIEKEMYDYEEDFDYYETITQLFMNISEGYPVRLNPLSRKEHQAESRKTKAFEALGTNSIGILSNQHLTDIDIDKLKTYLENNTSLQRLDLSNNQITNKGAETLKSFLLQNTWVFSIELGGNAIDLDLQKAIQDELSPDSRLSTVLDEHNQNSELLLNWSYIHSMIQNGAIIDRRSISSEWQWLHIAVKCDQWDSVKLLLERGAKPSATNDKKEKKTVLHLAVIYGTAEHVKWLAETYPEAIFEKDSEKRTPLHVAIVYNHLESFIVLLSLGFSTSYMLNRAEAASLFSLAIALKRTEFIKFLLKHGIEILPEHLESLDDKDESTKIIRDLLKNRRKQEGDFFKAVNCNGIRDLEKLIIDGVNINCHDEQRKTPFYHAVKAKNYELIAFLLHHGADRSSADEFKEFTSEEKNNIGQFGLIYLQKSPRAIISYLNCNTYIANQNIFVSDGACSPFSMEKIYEYLYASNEIKDSIEFKYFRPIVKSLEYSKNIEIHYDPVLNTTRRIDPHGNNSRGTTDFEKGRVYIGGKESFQDLASTTIHEFTHLFCQNRWGNSAKPYHGYELSLNYMTSMTKFDSFLDEWKNASRATSRVLIIYNPEVGKWNVYLKIINHGEQFSEIKITANSRTYKELFQIKSEMDALSKGKKIKAILDDDPVFKGIIPSCNEHDKKTEELFTKIIKGLHEIYEKRQNLIKKNLFLDLKNVPPLHNLFCEIFELYDPRSFHCELIVRGIQIIAKHGEDGIKILQEQAPELLEFINKALIPECLKYNDEQDRIKKHNAIFSDSTKRYGQWVAFEKASNISLDIVEDQKSEELEPTKQLATNPNPAISCNPFIFTLASKEHSIGDLLKHASVKPQVAIHFSTEKLAKQFAKQLKEPKVITKVANNKQFIVMLSVAEYEVLMGLGASDNLFKTDSLHSLKKE